MVIKPRLFYQVVKNLGQPRPLRTRISLFVPQQSTNTVLRTTTTGTVPKTTLAPTLTSANGVREKLPQIMPQISNQLKKKFQQHHQQLQQTCCINQILFRLRTTPIQVHTLVNYLENYDPFLANYLIQCSPFASESHIKGHAILYCPTISLPSRVRSIIQKQESLNNCYITALLAALKTLLFLTSNSSFRSCFKNITGIVKVNSSFIFPRRKLYKSLHPKRLVHSSASIY